MTSIEIITALSVIAGLLAAFGLGTIAGHERGRRQRRTIRRQDRSIQALMFQRDDAEERADLAGEALDRATGGTEDIVRAVTDATGRARTRHPRGAHHRPDSEPEDCSGTLPS